MYHSLGAMPDGSHAYYECIAGSIKRSHEGYRYRLITFCQLQVKVCARSTG